MYVLYCTYIICVCFTQRNSTLLFLVFSQFIVVISLSCVQSVYLYCPPTLPNSLSNLQNTSHNHNQYLKTFVGYTFNPKMATTPARKRLMRDFKKLQEDPPAGVSAAPKGDNILSWQAIIFGPKDTPFEDGTFNLSLEFNEEYPNKAPIVKFVSPMFHPNVYTDGSICLDILKNQWSPTFDISAILTSIQSLLDEPNPNSPANNLAAQLYTENRREYILRVKTIVEQSWLDDKAGKSDKEIAPTTSAGNNALPPASTVTAIP